MNIRDLSYICAVAKHGHFGKAAKACHVSQPALSGQIIKLEAELGVTLFERDNRSVRLTAIGQDIVALAEEALGVVANIREAAQSARDPLSGEFVLGTIPTIAPYLLPAVVGKTAKALPALRLQFMEDITQRLTEGLLNGAVDGAILATPPQDDKLAAVPLYDEPFWVIYARDHQIRDIAAIRTKDLPLDQLLLLSEGHCFRDQAMDVCELDHSAESYTVRATSLETLINMVAAKQGITLVPAMAVQAQWQKSGRVQAKRLSDKEAYRRVYFTYRKSFPRRALIKVLSTLLLEDLPDGITRL